MRQLLPVVHCFLRASYQYNSSCCHLHPDATTNLELHMTLHQQHVHRFQLVDESVLFIFLSYFRPDLGDWHVQRVHLLYFWTLTERQLSGAELACSYPVTYRPQPLSVGPDYSSLRICPVGSCWTVSRCYSFLLYLGSAQVRVFCARYDGLIGIASWLRHICGRQTSERVCESLQSVGYEVQSRWWSSDRYGE